MPVLKANRELGDACHRRELACLTGLRGAAALAVLLYHAARHVDKTLGAPELTRLLQAGHAGVDLFFVISGFIILHVHREDIHRPRRLPRYAARRVNRVFPLYWIALALTLAMEIAGGEALPSLPWATWSAALAPSVDEPLVGVAWTLQYEVLFYAVFAAVIVNRQAGLVLLAGWLAWIAAAAAGWGSDGVPAALCGAYGLEFFMGMAAAQAFHVDQGQRQRPAAGRITTAWGLALFAGAAVCESMDWLDGHGIAARFAYGVPSSLIVLGMAVSERRGNGFTSGWHGFAVIGRASYSVYLFQFAFIGLAWQALLALNAARALPAVLVFAALVGAALFGGILVARYVERPLLRATSGKARSGLRPRAGRAA